MILTLTAVSLNDRPLAPAPSARFDDHGGTIGRADHNTLALPDPERFISRTQAEVVASGTSFLIRNVGSANAIQVGARSLAGGQSSVLQHGEDIRIGGYLIKAHCPAQDVELPEATRPSQPLPLPLPLPLPQTPPAPQPAPAPPARPASQAPLQATAVAGLSDSNPFAELLGAGRNTAADPFADLFGAPPPPSAFSGSLAPARRTTLPEFLPGPAGIDERSAALQAPPPAASANRLPDDFDPFAGPSTPRAAAAAAAPVDPFADLMPAVPAVGIDQAFGLADGRHDDPLAHFLSSPGRPTAGTGSGSGGTTLSTDPLELFGAPPPPALPAAPAQADQVSALNAAYRPPRLQAATPVPAPPVPQPPPPPPPAEAQFAPVGPAGAGAVDSEDAQALWQAFCTGAGVQLPLPPGSGAERMQAIGAMMRTAVEGTLQLMAVRASTKHELRAAVTMIQQRNNNPLKFSPDAASGIEQLVQPPARGFLDGPAALEEAMHDLVGHSIGTVAGMRSAIEGMLGRFDPAALEAKLSGGSMLDSLLPMNRRARLWDLYLQHHDAIREEAQEDFHNLFGKAFLAAYEQQIERLRLEKQRR